MILSHPARSATLPPAALLLVLSIAPATLAQEPGGAWDFRQASYGSWDDDYFGFSVAPAGDVDLDGSDDFLVGAPWMGSAHRGMAWLYSGRHPGQALSVFQAVGDLDYFGWSVAGAGFVDQDAIPDILVGAPDTDAGGLQNAGSVLVYSGADNSLILRLDGQAAGDSFGHAVACAGDLDGDGSDDLLIGAPWASPNGLSSAGSAFVFSGRTGVQLLRIDGPNASGGLGRAVCGPGDLDGDGTPDLLLGAPGTYSSSSGGSVSLYSGATGSLIYQRNAGLGSSNESLGASVGTTGDVDGDGIPDFLVGDPDERWPYLGKCGGALLVSGASGTILHAFTGERDWDQYGCSVAGGEDLDLDGVPDLVIGAMNAEYTAGSSWRNTGAAFLYSGADFSLIRSTYPPEPERQSSAEYGAAVAVLGDLDRDGRGEVVVGSPWFKPPSLNFLPTGAVFVLDHNPWFETDTPQLSASGPDLISFSIDFPVSEGGAPYSLFFSRYGTGPTHHAGLDVPLAWDPVQRRTAKGWQPSFVQNGSGTLTISGHGSMTIYSAPELIPLVGQTLHLAVITYDLPSRIPRLSSSAVAIEITP